MIACRLSMWVSLLSPLGSSDGLYRCTGAFGGERHFDVDWSPIIEDTYSPKLGNPLRCRGSACVEVMTTLHGSMIASIRDLLKSTYIHLEPPSPCSIDRSMGLTSWIRVEGRLIRRYGFTDGYRRSVLEAMASIQEAIASLGRRIDGQAQQSIRMVPSMTIQCHHPLHPPLAKFEMPDIERYTGIGCPRLHLRLYNTVMRAHGLDEPQMITLFPLSLSGAAQRWFASLEASRRRTWDDLAQEFLRQFSFNTVVDVSRRELEALRQRAEESVSSFISVDGKIAEIIDRPSREDQIEMVLRSCGRIAGHVVGARSHFRSLVMALYDVEDDISRGLWTILP
ncbi:hypothetical protein AAG906_025788 [Vitis piasezkii]